jgi:acetyl esterase/lipase
MEIGPLPALAPELIEPLDRYRAWVIGAVDIPSASPLERWRHERTRILRAPWVPDPFGGFAIRQVEIVGHGGRPLSLVVYAPETDAMQGVIYFAHGGGMVTGSVGAPEVDHLLDTARELSLMVIEVDYALAPEYPFPAGPEDVYHGLKWVAAESESLGYPAGRVVLAGWSGGGTVALGAALLARDRGGPNAAGILLEAPMLDDRCDSVVHRQLGRIGLEDMWDAYLEGRRGADEVSPIAAPARATDLAGLPPVLIDVGTADQFRDEATALASRIWSVGGRADLHVWEGCPHGFEIAAPDTDTVRELFAVRRKWVARVLERVSRTTKA